MAQYDKPLITLVITTTCGTTETISDTATDATATNVWGLLKDRSDALWKDGSSWNFIPFDNVCKAVATITTTSVTKPDGFCEEIPDPCP